MPSRFHRLAILSGLVLTAGCFWRVSVPPVPPPPSQLLTALEDDLALQEVGLSVQVDSARGAVIALAGPFFLPPSADGGMQGHVHGEPMRMHQQTPIRFDWPVEGWVRGFELRLYDSDGVELPPEYVHHFVVINFDRRDMVYPTVERLLGVGQETGDVVLPSSVGVPIEPGTRMGMYAMWDNQSGREIEAYLRLVLRWTPVTATSTPRAVIPVSLDVNHVPGASSAYDLPPGRSERSFEFRVPVDGRFLALSGHMHDYGIRVRLEDVTEGKQIGEVKAIRDEAGRLLRVEQKKRLGFLWRGIRLHADRTYRIAAEYDSPMADTLRMGAMGHMVAAFAPDDWRVWPEIDTTHPDYLTDVAGWGLALPSKEFMRSRRGEASGRR